MLALSATIKSARLHTAFQQTQNLRIKRLGAVEQDEIDRVGKVHAQRLERVALPDLHEIDDAARLEIGLSARRLGWLELARDQTATAIVAQSRGKVQGGDAKRGSELDDGPRA